MKMIKFVLATAIAVAILYIGACSGNKPLYTNEVYNDVYWIDDNISFKIDMLLPMFGDEYPALNKAIQEQKQLYIKIYDTGCELAIQMYKPEYGLPNGMGLQITYKVDTDRNIIIVTMRNEYYLAGARSHIETTVLRYDTENDSLLKGEHTID